MALPLGDSRVIVRCVGFESQSLVLTVGLSGQVTKDVWLKLGGVGTVIEIPSDSSSSARKVRKRKRWWNF